MPTRVFVDSKMLRGVLSDKPSEGTEARREFSRLRNNAYDVVVPQVAIGEVVSVVMRDFVDPNTVHTKLAKLYDNIASVLNVATCMPPPTAEAIRCASELKNSDSMLDETDLLIVSQALVDPDSRRLLTTDSRLISSRAIKEKEIDLRETQRVRNHRLKIVDGLGYSKEQKFVDSRMIFSKWQAPKPPTNFCSQL